MPRKSVNSSRVMARLVEEWNIDFISPSQVQETMGAIRMATTGLSDEVEPKCLIACALELRMDGALGHTPVECPEIASADDHSIQENGVLSLIARTELEGSRSVLRFFPTASRLVNLARGAAGYPGSEWMWNIERIKPVPLWISVASIGHFACGDHDGFTFRPINELRLPEWDSYIRIDERNCPPDYRDVARRLSLLAYRTLLFRGSQFRGTESVNAEKLREMIRPGNRFGVDSLRENLDETARVMTPLYRHKSLFDRRMTEVAKGPLVHHIAPFVPIVPYAASEYLPIRHRAGRGKRQEDTYEFASCNVLPDRDQTWLIVSYPATSDQSLETSASNYVRDFTCVNPTLRREKDIGCLSAYTNVYASPDHYSSLAPEIRETVETAIASKLCEEPYEMTLEHLKRSDAGNKLVRRIQQEIARDGA